MADEGPTPGGILKGGPGFGWMKRNKREEKSEIEDEE